MLIDFITICGIAFFVIVAFYIQRKCTPTVYFGFKRYIYEISHYPLRVKNVIAKVAVIVAITLVCYLFFQPDLIITGISLGCFLIVWPEIIAPEYSYGYSPRARLLLLTIYIFFICASGLLAGLTISFINYYNPYEVAKSAAKFIVSLFGISWFKYFLNLQLVKESQEINEFVSDPVHSLNYNEIAASDMNIDKLENKINEIIDIKPVLGGQKWFLTGCQWLLDDVALIEMEDGHKTITLYIKYDPNNEDLKILHLVDEI